MWHFGARSFLSSNCSFAWAFEPGAAQYTSPGGPPKPVTESGPAGEWMQRPTFNGPCPPGLEYLTQIDQLLIQQKVELLELVTGWETKNKYAVKNSMGQQVFFAKEESTACMRLCCGSGRGFVMHIMDNNQQDVLLLRRRFKCCGGCCWCACAVDVCAYEVEAITPSGERLGIVRQKQTAWKQQFAICNDQDEEILYVQAPCCACSCCSDIDFPVISSSTKENVGNISKQFTGIIKEAFTDADSFGVQFPMDLDVKVKATMMGAVFLIDFMYFEDNNDDNHHH